MSHKYIHIANNTPLCGRNRGLVLNRRRASAEEAKWGSFIPPAPFCRGQDWSNPPPRFSVGSQRQGPWQRPSNAAHSWLVAFNLCGRDGAFFFHHGIHYFFFEAQCTAFYKLHDKNRNAVSSQHSAVEKVQGKLSLRRCVYRAHAFQNWIVNPVGREAGSQPCLPLLPQSRVDLKRGRAGDSGRPCLRESATTWL